MRKTIPAVLLATALTLGAGRAWAGAAPPPLTIAGNGVANAFIVVGGGVGVSDGHAAAELASFLGQVTGGSFPVYNSLQVGGPNLLVGPAAAQLGDPAFTTAGLGEEGIVIRRAGSPT